MGRFLPLLQVQSCSLINGWGRGNLIISLNIIFRAMWISPRALCLFPPFPSEYYKSVSNGFIRAVSWRAAPDGAAWMSCVRKEKMRRHKMRSIWSQDWKLLRLLFIWRLLCLITKFPAAAIFYKSWFPALRTNERSFNDSLSLSLDTTQR